MVRVRDEFSICVVSGYAHVFVLLCVISVTLSIMVRVIEVSKYYNHAQQQYLPENITLPYQLKVRSHHMTLIHKTKFCNDIDFMVRMLWKYSYYSLVNRARLYVTIQYCMDAAVNLY